MEQHFKAVVNGKPVDVKNLAAHAKFDPGQRWYYYHGQTTDEITVFRHFTEGRFFANMHTAFRDENCPKTAETRKSIETRAILYW